ncbi:MAG TPA: ribose-5-phosphate isomerase RpiA [Gemmatales bacterium]|nr:ribose-5-phosphate isomerase RpiA [Gemmatales bacterium]
MTIIERTLELVHDESCIGLGSGRAAQAFVRALGNRIKERKLSIRGVPTSIETEAVARERGVPLVSLETAGILDMTIDRADEVDPHLNLIKGYGHALVREKIVAASSNKLVILIGEEKLVSQLGSRRRLPIEVVPFALPLCHRRLIELGMPGRTYEEAGKPVVTDNGNYIIDVVVGPLHNPIALQATLKSIPGVVDTGLFLGMAHIVMVGKTNTFELVQELSRTDSNLAMPGGSS